jgi:hypothetical protein
VAVVINEFEVVAEPPPAKAPDQARQEKPQEPPSPHDIENVLRRRHERCERLRAH